MKKDQDNSKKTEINKTENINPDVNTKNNSSDININYELDEKEISNMLEDFNSEEIKIPEKLNEELDKKLNNIKPKKINIY